LCVYLHARQNSIALDSTDAFLLLLATAHVTWAHYPSMMKVCLVFLIANAVRSLSGLHKGGFEAPLHEQQITARMR